MFNNSYVREYAKEHGVKLWEVAIRMDISQSTMTRKLRVELSDAEKTAFLANIDAIAADKAKEKAATV